MRVISRKEFLEQPAGIVYSLYRPCIIDGLYVKGETMGNDWVFQDMIDTVDVDNCEERFTIVEGSKMGKDFKMNYDCMGRDGLYEEDGQFIIYSDIDVNRLAMHLIMVSDNYPI